MKKILVITASICIGSYAMAQHTEGASQMNNSSAGKALLDGKAFVVMLSGNTSEGSTLNSDLNHSMDKTPPSQPNHADQGTDATKGTATPENKKMIMRFEHGMLRTSAKGNLKIDNCTYNSWGMESTGISFSADCRNTGSTTSESSKGDNNQNATGNASSSSYNSNAGANTTSSTTSTFSHELSTGKATATSVSPATEDNLPQSGTSTNPVNATVGNDNSSTETETTTSAPAASGKNSIQITGTVNGDSIHGTISCTKSDGTVKTYSYTGSKAGKNDLDLENEMGMK